MRVFGPDRVFQNVEIVQSKDKTLGEIDVLVLFGNRAIVLQAKSKKLTLAARKGNDLLLQSDFKAAVQDAVDQAFACAELLGDPSVTLRCKNGKTVPPTARPRTIFPISIVADHYPALAFQARHYLQAKSSERIVLPLVLDVFALDTITEMLVSPIRLLNYLSLRARFGNKTMMNHEHTLLSYHLKYNLWPGNDVDLMPLDDEFASDLEVSMIVRREGIAGAETPVGILTRMEGTRFAGIISEIEDEPNPIAIDLGLMLLELSEDTVETINKFINQVAPCVAVNGGLQSLKVSIPSASAGLTVHCGGLVHSEAKARLERHCAKHKYVDKAKKWFGLAVRPDGSVQVAVELVGPWEFNGAMETILKNARSRQQANVVTRQKVGRNDPCPCGSGKKYKHCCIGQLD